MIADPEFANRKLIVMVPVTMVSPATVITTVHNVPVNPVKVAVPTPNDDGVAVVPLIVKDVTEFVPTPPDHVIVNDVADETPDKMLAWILVIDVGATMIPSAINVPAAL